MGYGGCIPTEYEKTSMEVMHLVIEVTVSEMVQCSTKSVSFRVNGAISVPAVCLATYP